MKLASSHKRSTRLLLLRFGGPVALVIALAVVSTGQAQSNQAQANNGRDAQYQQLSQSSRAMQQQFSVVKQLVRTVQPTVAHIEAKKSANPTETTKSSSNSNRRPAMIEEAGSGVIVKYKNKFFVITNYHVIRDAQLGDIRVEADGKFFFPTRVVNDKATDLSVIFCNRTDLVPARIGNSDIIEIGDFVVAVGSPFGLSHSVSYGIISALGRRDLDLGPQGVRYQDFMQTDAAINPGNSGGPLMNLRGEVIGINTAIASNSGGNDGIGFSIPIKMAMRVAKDLIDHGKARRGFLGVSLDARYNPAKAAAIGLNLTYGARVSAITPGSPAEKADFQIGDVVLEVNGTRVANDSHLVTIVSMTDVGIDIPVKLFRQGRMKNIKVRIENRQGFDPRN